MNQINDFMKTILKGQTVTLDRIYDLVSTTMCESDAFKFLAIAAMPPLKFVKEYTTEDGEVRTFEKVDYWRLNVTYSHLETRYYETQEDADKQNYKYERKPSEKYSVEAQVRTHDSMSIENWPTEE
jgi:hypothetical protein